MRINHNISAQLANVKLKKADSRVAASLERLTSGYKINKAADDSAGMAITNKMKAQIRALDQSSRNTQDGSSIIETAESAMGEIESVLQRVRELAVQAANDTYILEDRETIQKEADQMLEEVDRIASTTEFNGKSLLDGSCCHTVSSDNAQIIAHTASMNVLAGRYSLSVDQLAEKAKLNVALPTPRDKAYSISINDASIQIDPTDTITSIQEKIVRACDAMNIKADTVGGLSMETNAPGSEQKITYKIDDTEMTEVGKDAVITLDASDPKEGFKSTATYSTNGNLITIVDNDGFEMKIEAKQAGTANIQVFDAGYMTLQIGANETQTLDVDFDKVDCVNLGLKQSDGTHMMNLCTQFGASNAISRLDKAISSLSAARSKMGAYQNRLDTTTDSLNLSSQNITEAMSRINDTDMAAEMTQYTQQDVISQAATSMLAQANNRPQQIMGLLQG